MLISCLKWLGDLLIYAITTCMSVVIIVNALNFMINVIFQTLFGNSASNDEGEE